MIKPEKNTAQYNLNLALMQYGALSAFKIALSLARAHEPEESELLSDIRYRIDNASRNLEFTKKVLENVFGVYWEDPNAISLNIGSMT